jgi:hypothetical protein
MNTNRLSSSCTQSLQNSAAIINQKKSSGNTQRAPNVLELQLGLKHQYDASVQPPLYQHVLAPVHVPEAVVEPVLSQYPVLHLPSDDKIPHLNYIVHVPQLNTHTHCEFFNERSLADVR